MDVAGCVIVAGQADGGVVKWRSTPYMNWSVRLRGRFISPCGVHGRGGENNSGWRCILSVLSNWFYIREEEEEDARKAAGGCREASLELGGDCTVLAVGTTGTE